VKEKELLKSVLSCTRQYYWHENTHITLTVKS
jgi:hypothetical protein